MPAERIEDDPVELFIVGFGVRWFSRPSMRYMQHCEYQAHQPAD
jgi:hypothetical protein